MESTGDQSRRPDESYAEHMDRLYRANPYANRKRDQETGAFVKSHNGTERPKWGFRVPNVLATKALKFMRAENMSITTYLTFAMHQLHTKNDD